MKTEIQRKKEREGERRRRSCHDGEGEKKGEIWFTTFPMFTNANGKRKCRKMRRPAVISGIRQKNGVLRPVSCFLTGIPLPVLFLLSCVRNVPFCGVSRCRFSRPFPVLRSPSSFSFFPSFRSFSFLSFFLLSAFFHLLVFFFFQGRRDPLFHLWQGKNEEGKVRFAFLFLFVCSPEEGGGRKACCFFFLLLGKERGNAFFLSVS